MNEIYWLTRLTAINNVFLAFLILGIIFSFIFTVVYLVNRFDTEDQELIQFTAKCLKWLYPLTIFISLIYVTIPTTKDAFIIYGIGGTIDYIKQDSIATQIPHKVIVAIDKYIDTMDNPEDKSEKE